MVYLASYVVCFASLSISDEKGDMELTECTAEVEAWFPRHSLFRR